MSYTHKISWMEYDELLEFFVSKEFRTMSDALELHLPELNKRNITNLKVETIYGN